MTGSFGNASTADGLDLAERDKGMVEANGYAIISDSQSRSTRM
jgi:hypothetical protein